MTPSSHEPGHVIGLDVQLSRGLAYAVLDPTNRVTANGWMDATDPQEVIDSLHSRFRPRAIGIDAPRCPLPRLREHFWTGGQWRKRRASDRGFGRHCEVVVSACGLGRPQWTPTPSEAPEWMAYGFALFAACQSAGVVAEEVFPSAAYTQLANDDSARIDLPLSQFASGPKDMLDAATAGFALNEFLAGRGAAVGDGDGLGRILLPRPVEHPNYLAVSEWPGS